MFSQGIKMVDTEPDFVTTLTTTIKGFHARYRWGEVGWSLAHYLMVFGGLLASFAATLTLNFGWSFLGAEYKQIATALTALSTLLGSLGAAGGFQGKWRSNRLSRSQLDCLGIDLSDPNIDADAVAAAATKLKQIVSLHDAQIVDADKDPQPTPDGPGKPDDKQKP